MGNTFLSLALLIIFHFFTATFSMKSTTISTDQTALLTLKHYVLRDPENLLSTNWSASTPVCRNLTFLTLLSVENNNFHGNLSKLESLSLFDNQISGRIPSSLFKCKELPFLSVSSNHLEGSLEVEIEDLSMLQFLNIGQNQFEGNVY
ncbi:hypothetical protein GQ457_17G004160 [Hibiscus cannabinus]